MECNVFANSAQSASFVVTLKEESFEKSVLSVSPETGKVEEYQVLLKAKMDLVKADGTFIIEDETLTVIRDFAFDETAVLGEFSEESIIQENFKKEFPDYNSDNDNKISSSELCHIWTHVNFIFNNYIIDLYKSMENKQDEWYVNVRKFIKYHEDNNLYDDNSCLLKSPE